MPATTLQSRVLLCGRARRYHYEGAMPLGVRTFRGGIARYRTIAGDYAVEDGCWLVLNDGQHYALEINSTDEVESTVVFFPPGWAALVARLYRERPELLLDDPVAPGVPVRFLEATVSNDTRVAPRLVALDKAGRYSRVEDAWLEEALLDLLADLLLSQHDHREKANRLPSARAATRAELYRRVCRGRDYLGFSALSAPRLADAAAVACLSPYHFHRSFKAAFGETPHEYTSKRRLAHADRLLATAMPATEVAAAVGYDSYSAFYAAYQQCHAASPSRRLARNQKYF
jgi:AraC family transcriptional regulator